MSRSGYTEDYDEQYPNALALYRSAVANAINGKRGQAFLQELIEALDAMPAKRLIAEELRQHGGVCALGSVGVKRGIELEKFHPDDHGGLSKIFGISRSMVQEIEFENDEGVWAEETPENRWIRMRAWAVKNLKEHQT